MTAEEIEAEMEKARVSLIWVRKSLRINLFIGRKEEDKNKIFRLTWTTCQPVRLTRGDKFETGSARGLLSPNHPQMVAVLNITSLLSIKLIFHRAGFEAHEHGQDKEGRRVTKGHTAENVVLLGGKSKGEFWFFFKCEVQFNFQGRVQTKRYERDEVLGPNSWDGFDRHNAEIVAFHLDRILNFRRAPMTVGRKIHFGLEMDNVAVDRLKTTFQSGTGVASLGSVIIAKRKSRLWWGLSKVLNYLHSSKNLNRATVT